MEERRGGSAHWLFQGNPKRYDLKERLIPEQVEQWLVSRYATRIIAGDTVWFWRSGERALYGWGEVLEEPHAMPGLSGIRAPIRYAARFDPPIPLDELLKEPRLGALMVVRAPQGTNFAITAGEAMALIELAARKEFIVPPPPFEGGGPAPFVMIGRETGQWLAPYLQMGMLVPPLMQTIDLLAAIHDRGIYELESAPPFARWLVTALTGTQPPEYGAISHASLFEQLKIMGHDPWSSDAYRDAEVKPELTGEYFSFGQLLSPALAESLDRALQIDARLTPPPQEGVTPPDIQTPALIAALLFSDWPAIKALLPDLGKGKRLAELREGFLSRIGELFGEEAPARWRPYTRFGAAELVLLGYDADLAKGKDALGIEPDVQAFASVIASQRLTPPLSIGLFGDWGSGKSFFMRKLKEQVETLAKAARIPDPDNPERSIANPASDFLPNIVQIEFNAWHYVESNLWASLVTHLFENLRIDTEEPDAKLRERRDKLLSEMDVAAKLRTIAEDERKAALKQLGEKQAQLRQLQFQRSQQRIEHSFTALLAALKEQACEDLLSKEAQAAIAKAREGNVEEVNRAYDELRRATRDAQALFSRAGRLWRGLKQLGRANLIWLGGLLAAVLIAGVTLPRLLELFGQEWEAALGALAALLSGGGAWLHRGVQKANVALEVIESAQGKLSAALAQSVPPPSPAEETLTQDLRHLENQLKIAEAQLQQAATRAEAAEAGLVEIERSASLAHFIEQRAASGDYREQLGILALIRRDFEQLSKRMTTTRKSPLPLDDPSRIDRIVLYIDDLDRCPAERVFEVLQAIHLLLAFDMFVVVVGVDERWLTRALALARAGMLRGHDRSASETDKALRDLNIHPGDTARPADFLEKIFQVAFWLQPLESHGFSRMLDEMLRLDKMRLARSTESGGKRAAAAKPEQGTERREAAGETATAGEALAMGNEPEESGDITSARPEAVAISETEAKMMRQLAPILGRSPRTAKRFVNLYRVLKAREYVASTLNPLLEAESLGGMLLLALVTGHPRGTKELLDTIEEAPAEQQVTAFMTWAAQPAPALQGGEGLGKLWNTLPAAIGEVISTTTAEHLSQLSMGHLQRWLPTVRRFSFRAEIARDSSYVDAFSEE